LKFNLIFDNQLFSGEASLHTNRSKIEIKLDEKCPYSVELKNFKLKERVFNFEVEKLSKEKLREITSNQHFKSQEIQGICCLCGENFYGYGNNPFPLSKEGACCSKCDNEKVIPARENDPRFKFKTKNND